MTPVAAMTRYTVRTAVPAKRWFLALIPCGVAVLFGLIAQGFDGSAEHDFARMAATALFGLVLPVASLVIGDAVLGGELRRGTFAFTWMSPVSARQIVVARWAGGSIVSTVLIAPAFALAAVTAGSPESAPAVALAGAAAASAYVAVFMAIGSIANRAAAWSLGFVFLIERLLGAAVTGIAQISPSWEGRAMFIGLVDPDPVTGFRRDVITGVVREVKDDLIRDGIPHGWAALVRLAVITAVALVITARRLPRAKMAGSSD
jgi:hypothetical protein